MVHLGKRCTTALQPLIPALYHRFMIGPCTPMFTEGSPGGGYKILEEVRIRVRVALPTNERKGPLFFTGGICDWSQKQHPHQPVLGTV